MHIVGSRLGDDVDRSAGGRAEVGTVVAAIDLEFQDVILVHGEAHAATVARGLTAVDGNAVAASVAAVK